MEQPHTNQNENEGNLKSLKPKIKKIKLSLSESGKENLLVGTKANGQTYSVRKNRDRFFYPKEWFLFFDNLNESQKMTFELLINTGARINEVIHIKSSDIDFERSNITLKVTKVKAKKGEKYPRPRTISISSQFCKRLRKYCRDKELINENGTLLKDDYLGLLSKPAAHIAMKKCLKKIGITDWYNFSLHNIRKTHGNYLKALHIEMAEICNRLGHDSNTYLRSYASPDIFNFKDKQDMRLILGDLYGK